MKKHKSILLRYSILLLCSFCLLGAIAKENNSVSWELSYKKGGKVITFSNTKQVPVNISIYALVEGENSEEMEWTYVESRHIAAGEKIDYLIEEGESCKSYGFRDADNKDSKISVCFFCNIKIL